MNISFNEAADEASTVSVASFLYRDVSATLFPDAKQGGQAGCTAQQEGKPQKGASLSAQEIQDAVHRARAQAVAETEQRLRKEYEARSAAEAAKIVKALELFQEERKDYFSRVESDVVHLALAIAAKILHHEVQVDPLLMATLVRVAVDKMNDVSSVSVHVAPAQADKWRAYLANSQKGSIITVVEDAHLEPDDCILETDLGSANFSIDAQLKEVGQGFLDLLAQRPVVK